MNAPPLRNPFNFDEDSSVNSRLPLARGSQWSQAGAPAASGDAAIRSTNDDAAISRLSAVRLGYLQDDYLNLLVRRFDRRPPIINRGTFVRVAAIHRLAERFIQSHNGQCQVVVLGSGSDTLYFLLRDKGLCPKSFVEIDFAEITSSKIGSIQRQWTKFFPGTTQPAAPATSNAVAPLLPGTRLMGRSKIARNTTEELHMGNYHILAGDLRQWESEVVSKLMSEQVQFDLSLPTLWLSECVLIYMEKEYSDSIVFWATKHQEKALFITYEQILPDDAFGKMMLQNLKTRGIELPGIHSYPTLKSQEERYLEHEWTKVLALDLNEVYERWISDDEKKRIAKIELLDELEEWRMLMHHYCICVASKGGVSII